jgi:UDP-3-O-[3-hydroxymyristoyl] glucosamine N-acyltransferase
MKNLIIIGSGGMGRSFFDIAKESIGYKERFIIKGFLDDNIHAMDMFCGYPPILGTIKDYQIQPDDIFTCSMGNVHQKKVCCNTILSKGGKFETLIHSTARIGTNVNIGTGTIIGPFSSLGAEASIGDFVLIQSYSIIAHDVIVKNWARIDTHVVCIGGTQVGEGATIHTGAVLNHKVKIGDSACVGANSFVIRSVKEGITVFGNPAKQI